MNAYNLKTLKSFDCQICLAGLICFTLSVLSPRLLLLLLNYLRITTVAKTRKRKLKKTYFFPWFSVFSCYSYSSFTTLSFLARWSTWNLKEKKLLLIIKLYEVKKLTFGRYEIHKIFESFFFWLANEKIQTKN